VAKKYRLLAPFPTTDQESVTKTASSDAEEGIPPIEVDADPLTAMQLKASAIRALPYVSPLLEYNRELTRGGEPSGVAPIGFNKLAVEGIEWMPA
jgi:hypothetical protein